MHLNKFYLYKKIKNRRQLIVGIIFLTYLTSFFFSYGFNLLVHAGNPGQFENFQNDSEKYMYEFVNESLDSGKYVKVSNYAAEQIYYQYALQSMIYSQLALRLQDIILIPLSESITHSDLVLEGYNIYSFKNITNLTINDNVNANLGNKISFIGYSISNHTLSPGELYSIKYYWKLIENVSKDYTILVHVIPVSNNSQINKKIINIGHNIFVNMDHEPAKNLYPTSKWKYEEILEERFNYILPDDMPLGTYRLMIGVYDTKGDPDRLEVLDKELSDEENRINAGILEVVDPSRIMEVGPKSSLNYFRIEPLGISLKSVFLNTFFIIIRLILAFLMSLIATMMVYVVYKNFGFAASFIFFLMLCFSNWIIFFARNSYWVIFLYFMPFLISFMYYPKCNSAIKKFILNFAIFLAVLIKALNDFEFITNVILIASVPIIYYEFRVADNYKKSFINIVPSIVFSVLGFLSAIIIHIYSLYIYQGRNLEFIGLIFKKILNRTNGIDNYFTNGIIKGYSNDIFNKIHPYNNDFISQLLFSIDYRIEYGHYDVITIPPFHLGIQLYQVELITAILCFWEIKSYLRVHGDKKFFALSIATISSFIVSNSWAICTAKGHMIAHSHMNSIIFYLPFLLMAFIMISLEMSRFLKKYVFSSTSRFLKFATK